jgi:hypothetical protein
MIHGGTPRDIRLGIINQMEHETGWLLAATDGTMSMGVSIKNLHGLAVAIIGHSPHVTLQAVGRMLRKHANKLENTIVYDIDNDMSAFGTSYAHSNAKDRLRYYTKEKYPILPTIERTI